MEAFQNDVNDKSMKVSDVTQYIAVPDDHTFSLNIKSRLPYMNICPYTDDEWKTLPHSILTSDDEWDSSILDYSIDDDGADNDEWYDAISYTSTKNNDTLFDSTREYKHRHRVHVIDIDNHDLENEILSINSIYYDVNEHEPYNTNGNNDTET